MKKGIRITKCMSLLLCVSLVTGLFAGCGLSAKRSIVAESVNGSVYKTYKESTDAVVKGENLTSGGVIDTDSASDLTLLLDSDKHVYIGEESKVLLTAEGSKNKTKTNLELKVGTLKCAIDNKLKEKEAFEVETENMVMAVRGTTFSVKYVETAEGRGTEIAVKEGTVEVSTVENGELKSFTLTAGQENTYYGENPDESFEAAENYTETSYDEGYYEPLYNENYQEGYSLEYELSYGWKDETDGRYTYHTNGEVIHNNEVVMSDVYYWFNESRPFLYAMFFEGHCDLYMDFATDTMTVI